MKRILIVLAMVPMFAQAAEIAPGTVEVKGSSDLGFSSGSTKRSVSGVSETVDNTAYGLQATGLYYVIPDFGVGLILGYSNSESKLNGITNGYSRFVIGPAVAYDFPVQPNLSLFVAGDIGYATATVTETGEPDIGASGFAFDVGAGIKYFFVKQFSVDAGVGYGYAKLTQDELYPGGPKPEITDSGFGVNVGLSVYFGK